MTIKNKIITIVVCVFIGFALLTGAYCIGRFTRYSGTTTIGQDAINTADQVTSDLNNAGNELNVGINLLDPVVQSNILMMQTIDTLQKSKDETINCLDGFVDLLSTSQKNIDSFVENYKGNKDSEDFALEYMIKEAQELEAIQEMYVKLLEDYSKLKEGR